MVGVVADIEVFPDHLRDARRGPEIGSPAVGERTLDQQPDEAIPLPGCQLWGSARGGPDLKGPLSLATECVSPPHHGTGRAGKAAADLIERQPLLKQRQRSTPTVLQNLRRPLWPHGGHPPSGCPILLHFLCRSQ